MKKKRLGFVYILTNRRDTVLYIGVTSNLVKKVWEHKEKLVEGFTRKYKLTKLIYFEMFDSIEEAIKREKYLKGKRRSFKLDLIRAFNPSFKDLYSEIV